MIVGLIKTPFAIIERTFINPLESLCNISLQSYPYFFLMRGLFFGITPKKFIFFSRMYGNQCCVIQSTNFFRLSEFNALIEMFNTFVFVLNPISGAFNWQYR
jgi:hypothetical protein